MIMICIDYRITNQNLMIISGNDYDLEHYV